MSATYRLEAIVHNANAFINLPSLDTWENLQPLEQERREGILRNIGIRMSEYGPHRAIASPKRGRLFMPFAALTGYESMIEHVEHDVNQTADNHNEP